MNPLPLQPRSKLVIGFLGLCIFGAALSLWAETQQLSLINRAIDGGRVTLAEARTADDRVQWTSGVALVGYLPVIIAFLLWFSRGYRSIEALTGGARYRPRDAVLSWFVPFLNLVRPKQAMNDLWRAGDPDLPRNTDAETLAARPVSPLVHWWWAVYLLSGVIFRISMTSGNGAPTAAERVHSRVTAEIFADLGSIASAVLAILVVRTITERLEARRGTAMVAAVPSPPPFAPPEPIRDVSGSVPPPGF